MSNISRRSFLYMTTGATLVAYAPVIMAQTKKVVIIGGGVGGIIAAKEIRKADSTIEVTLIERNKYYHTGFMSNEVLSGDRTIDAIKFNYNRFHKYGIKMVYNRAIGIDPAEKRVSLQGGGKIAYDRLIVSPGIDFQWDAIEGYDETVIDKIPHAWKAGSQTIILRKQLEAMKDGGTVIISVPRQPSSCPIAPYERASLIALYLKQYKSKSKVLILDAKSAIPQQESFIQGWEKLYGFGTDNSLIEWIPAHDGGTVMSVEVDHKTVIAGEFEDEYTAEVINIIPPQIAGRIAKESGLVDESGWCPVNQKTFESRLQKDIYVIGDACITKMPKSAYSANTQAKICAKAIVLAFRGINEMPVKSHFNTCYSIVGKDFGISSAAVYRLEGDTIQVVQDADGISHHAESFEDRKREVVSARRWYKNITQELF